MSAKGCKCQRTTRAKEGKTCAECNIEETDIDEKVYQNIEEREINIDSTIVYDDIEASQNDKFGITENNREATQSISEREGGEIRQDIPPFLGRQQLRWDPIPGIRHRGLGYNEPEINMNEQNRNPVGLKPPRFQSFKDDINKFLSRYEKFADLFPQWNEARKAGYLGNLLCDESLDFFDSLEDEIKGDYEAVKRELIEHYENSGNLTLKWSKLAKRKQQKGESLSQYYDALMRLASNLEIPDRQMLYFFLDGLPQKTREYISLSADAPETLKAAYMLAKKYQGLENNTEGGIELPRANTIQADELGAMKLRLENLTEQVAKLTQGPRTSGVGQYRGPPPPLNRPIRYNNNTHRLNYDRYRGNFTRQPFGPLGQAPGNFIGRPRTYFPRHNYWQNGNNNTRPTMRQPQQFGNNIRVQGRGQDNAYRFSAMVRMGGQQKGIAHLIPRPREDKRSWEYIMALHAETLKNKKGTTILVGDSIVQNLNIGKGLSNKNIVNLGIAGDRVQNMLWRVQLMDLKEATTAIILGGTNNLSQNTPDEIAKTLIKMAQTTIESTKRRAKVTIMGILPRGHQRSYARKQQGETNKRIQELCGNGGDVTYYDPGTEWVHQNGGLKRNLFKKDLLHLTSEGKELLEKKIADIIGKSTEAGAHTNTTTIRGQWEIRVDENMIIKGKIEGNHCELLLDTGSEVSLIDSRLARKISTKPIEQTEIEEVLGVSNSTNKIQGQIKPTITFGANKLHVRLLIMDNLSSGIILGRDELSKWLENIDYVKGVITVTNHKPVTAVIHTEQPTEQEKIITNRVANDTVIPAMGSVQLELECDIDNAKVEVRGRDILAKQGAIVALKRGDIENNMITCDVFNINKEPVLLAKGLEACTLKTGKKNPTQVFMTKKGQENSPQIKERQIIMEHKGDNKETNNPGSETRDRIDKTPLEGNEEDQVAMRGILREYEDVFAVSEKQLKCMAGVEHSIYVKDETPIRSRPYKADVKSQEIIDKHVTEMLEAGIIEKSYSEWAFPVLLVSKPDGSVRFCVDYRKLNKIIVQDIWPLPNIQLILDTLGGAEWFSVMDLKSGFFQIKMEQFSKRYTAFIVKNGQYEFNFMPYGISNNPSAFTRAIQSAFQDLNWKILVFYIDDFIVYGRTLGQLRTNMRKVLDRMRQYDLKVNIKKCHFQQKKVKFLGHIISAKGLELNPEILDLLFDKTKKIRY